MTGERLGGDQVAAGCDNLVSHALVARPNPFGDFIKLGLRPKGGGWLGKGLLPHKHGLSLGERGTMGGFSSASRTYPMARNLFFACGQSPRRARS